VRKPNALPKKLPKTANSIHGPIKIVWLKDKGLAKVAGVSAWGLAHYASRTLYLNEQLREKGSDPHMMWKVYHHESHHFHMEDTGLNQVFGPMKREIICEAYAQARMNDMLYGSK
jgi:hypothetical protein